MDKNVEAFLFDRCLEVRDIQFPVFYNSISCFDNYLVQLICSRVTEKKLCPGTTERSPVSYFTSLLNSEL